MEVYGKQLVKVEINPENVISNLKSSCIGSRSWVTEKDGKFLRGFDGGVSHYSEEYEEISEEKYKFVRALEFITDYLKKEEE